MDTPQLPDTIFDGLESRSLHSLDSPLVFRPSSPALSIDSKAYSEPAWSDKIESDEGDPASVAPSPVNTQPPLDSWPAAMRFDDISAMQDPADRALAYAQRIRHLAIFDSGLSQWMAASESRSLHRSQAGSHWGGVKDTEQTGHNVLGLGLGLSDLEPYTCDASTTMTVAGVKMKPKPSQLTLVGGIRKVEMKDDTFDTVEIHESQPRAKTRDILLAPEAANTEQEEALPAQLATSLTPNDLLLVALLVILCACSRHILALYLCGVGVFYARTLMRYGYRNVTGVSLCNSTF